MTFSLGVRNEMTSPMVVN